MASGFLLTEQDMTEFRAEYGELIRRQCISLMGKTEAAKDLEEQVYRFLRENTRISRCRSIARRC